MSLVYHPLKEFFKCYEKNQEGVIKIIAVFFMPWPIDDSVGQRELLIIASMNCHTSEHAAH